MPGELVGSPARPAAPANASERTLTATYAGAAAAPGVLHIGRLSLHVPGVSADAGQRLARRVSSLVAARLPHGLSGEIHRLSLDVQQPARGGEAALAGAVADAIVRAATRAKGGF